MLSIISQYASGDAYRPSVSIQIKRIHYLDDLRVLATLAVVLLHVSARYWGVEEVSSPSWLIATFYDGIVRWCVPVFVMISGALLLDPNRSVKQGWRIKRVLIPLVIWSGIYALVDYARGVAWENALKTFLTGHYHLWYIYMLIGLYLILPLLRKITEDERHETYFLVLVFLFNFLIPQCTEILKIAMPGPGSLMEVITGKMNIQFVLGYSGYFVLGHWLHYRVLRKEQCLVLCLAGTIGIVLTVILTFTTSILTAQPEKLFFSYFTCNVLLTAIAVFVLFRSNNHSSRADVLIKKMSDHSFGVFLIHPLVLETLGGMLPEMSLAIRIPVTALLVFAVSLLITALLRSVPKVGQLMT